MKVNKLDSLWWRDDQNNWYSEIRTDIEKLKNRIEQIGYHAAIALNDTKRLAQRGTMKRRRATVRAGNQVVEVVRN